MNGEAEKWDRVSIELPPGWHAVLVKLSDLSGLKLKYLYTLAVERLLDDSDLRRVIEDAWTTDRRTKTDLAQVGRGYTPAKLEERYRQAIKTKDASPSKNRKKKKPKS